jgi:branched-chain amino acid transport system ATP-binding protein
MLTIEGLNTHYGASHVLQGVDLVVPPGRICALLGRNGVGKSTTLRSVMGLVTPTSGRLIFPDLTVIENIKVAERNPAKSWPIPRLLEMFPSLRERARNKGAHLSGGEQQMLAIARALVSDPKMLLLDEPSQGLAPLVVRELARVIQILCDSGVTILLVEQNMKLAEAVANELHIMVKGRMVYGASPEKFRAEEAEIRSRYLTV